MAASFVGLLLLSTLAGIRAQPSASPAPSPAASLYQRPLNSDCFNAATSASSQRINFFPQNYHITGVVSNDPASRTTVTVAQDFSVQYFDTYKVVTNNLVNETYVLYQCGTAAPATNSLPLGSKIFAVPLNSVAVLETVPVAFLDQLGVMSRVQSVSDYAVGACGQKLLGCNRTSSISSLSTNASALNTQLAPLTDGIVTSSAYSNALNTFAFSASQDPGVLNRAEWIKFLGMFFNLDAAATQAFNAVNSSYYATKGNITASDNRPTLAFVQYYSYAPNTAYEVSIAAYKKQYTQDAGAKTLDINTLLQINGTMLSPLDVTNSTVWFPWNLTSGGFTSQAQAATAFKTVLEKVDVIIDETFALDPTTYNLTTFLNSVYIDAGDNKYPFLTNSSIYREDRLVSPAPSYGLDWFEGAIARPDRVLLDFAQAVKPSSFPDHTRVWLRNIAKNETVNIVSTNSCNQVSSCAAAPTPICPLVSLCSGGSVAPQQNATSTCQYAACSA